MKLRDKVAIVTGGAKGIGLGITRSFLGEGAAIVIADNDEAGGRQAVLELDSPRASLHVCDVSSGSDVQRLIETVVRQHGRLDLLVNNAGTHVSKSVENTSEAEWERVINTNLKSTFLCCKHAIPELRKTRGTIVNISSMVGLVGQSNAGAYSASKGGQIAMTKGLALDLAKDGVRANVICPGWVKTPLVEDWFGQQPDPQAAREYIYSVHPLGRIALVDEIGRAAVFLASEESSFITGVALPVDGAVTLGY